MTDTLTVNAYGCDPASIPQDHADRVARALGLASAVRIGCGGFLWSIKPGVLTITAKPFDRSNPRIVSVPWEMIERFGEATAWLHHVVSDGGEQDLALSFYRDSFPLDGVAGYRSISAVPLYAHSPTPTPPPAGGVPEGWKMVPVEPTTKMLESAGTMEGFDPDLHDYADRLHTEWWHAMLAAAPAPEAGHG